MIKTKLGLKGGALLTAGVLAFGTLTNGCAAFLHKHETRKESRYVGKAFEKKSGVTKPFLEQVSYKNNITDLKVRSLYKNAWDLDISVATEIERALKTYPTLRKYRRHAKYKTEVWKIYTPHLGSEVLEDIVYFFIGAPINAAVTLGSLSLSYLYKENELKRRSLRQTGFNTAQKQVDYYVKDIPLSSEVVMYNKPATENESLSGCVTGIPMILTKKEIDPLLEFETQNMNFKKLFDLDPRKNKQEYAKLKKEVFRLKSQLGEWGTLVFTSDVTASESKAKAKIRYKGLEQRLESLRSELTEEAMSLIDDNPDELEEVFQVPVKIESMVTPELAPELYRENPSDLSNIRKLVSKGKCNISNTTKTVILEGYRFSEKEFIKRLKVFIDENINNNIRYVGFFVKDIETKYPLGDTIITVDFESKIPTPEKLLSKYFISSQLIQKASTFVRPYVHDPVTMETDSKGKTKGKAGFSVYLDSDNLPIDIMAVNKRYFFVKGKTTIASGEDDKIVIEMLDAGSDPDRIRLNPADKKGVIKKAED